MSANENCLAGLNGQAVTNIKNASNYTTSWPAVPAQAATTTGNDGEVSALYAFGRKCRSWGAAVTAIKSGTKQPAHKWGHWQKQAQADDEFERLPWRSAAALGVINGAGDWRVFDLDAVKDDDGRPVAPVPEEVVVELLKALGLPDDYQWSYVSGSGAGFGVVIRCTESLPAGWKSTKGIYIGSPREGRVFGQLELRWSSGQTVIDGAHPIGPGYRWRLGERPFVAPALLTAERIIAGFTAIAAMDMPAGPKPTAAPPSRTAKGSGYGAAALADAVDKVRWAANGTRNKTLFREAAGLAELVNGGTLNRGEVERQITAAALAAGLTIGEIRAAVASAFNRVGNHARQSPTGSLSRSARVEPLDAPRPSPLSDLNQSANPSELPPIEPGAGSPNCHEATDILVMDYRPEDGGIMDAWHFMNGESWFYVTGFEEWYFWTGKYWQPDKGGYTLKAQIAALMDAMNRQARELRAEAGDDRDEYKRLSAYVEATKRTAARVASVEGLARLKCFIGVERLDAADSLNLANGTLDLSTLTLRRHERSDLLTYCLPYDFDPEAAAPNWEIVLNRIEDDIVTYLQEYAGYALTPDTQHEQAIWLYGPPGRGASTLLTGLQAMLGPKAVLLGLADIERNRFALANLPGKTLAVATEQPADYMAATHVLNALISGEPVTVDRKFKDAITVTPQVKLAWAMNELPRVKGASNGIFRRVKVVTFPSIPDHERQPELKEAVKSEPPGILNWALAGLKRLRERGHFLIPVAVEAASRAFAEQNDIPKAFVNDRCVIDPNYSVGSQQLYNAYTVWCLETGHKPQSLTSIADDWKRLGFVKTKTASCMIWLGLTLNP